MAAGGTTAFAEKMVKSAQGLLNTLKNLPEDAFLTDEEFEEAMRTLNQSKWTLSNEINFINNPIFFIGIEWQANSSTTTIQNINL